MSGAQLKPNNFELPHRSLEGKRELTEWARALLRSSLRAGPGSSPLAAPIEAGLALAQIENEDGFQILEACRRIVAASRPDQPSQPKASGVGSNQG